MEVRVDARLYEWVNRLADATGWAHPPMIAVATYGIGLFAALLVAAFLDGRHRGDLHRVATSIWAGAAAIVALAVAAGIGGVVGRARPFDVVVGAHVLIARSSDVSFPSDHATAVGAIAVALLLGRHRRAGLIAAGGAVVMAFARVYVGVHYPSDVLAGLALGALVAVIGTVVVVPMLVRLVSVIAGSRLRWVVTAGPDAAPVVSAG
jgi:undecaprenyl-diphosphatase